MGPASETRHTNRPERVQQGYRVSYSMTSSARAKSAGGTVRRSTLAVLRLMANSIFVVWITGRSAGFWLRMERHMKQMFTL